MSGVIQIRKRVKIAGIPTPFLVYRNAGRPEIVANRGGFIFVIPDARRRRGFRYRTYYGLLVATFNGPAIPFGIYASPGKQF